MLKPTRYYTSIILRFDSVDRFLYRFADRDEFDDINYELVDRVRSCMIYLICCRPIVTIIPETFRKSGESYAFDISFRIKGVAWTATVRSPKGLINDKDRKVSVSTYPHKSLLVFDADDNLLEDILIANRIHLFDGVPSEIADLQILYIGKGTADCAVDRLDGHSTLEKILADVLRDEPSSEVAILLYNFEMHKDAMSDPGIANKAEIRGQEAKEHFEKIISYKPNKVRQTEIIEALLIDYFKPSRYNVHFTNQLSSKLKTLNDIYQFDFDAVIVRVNNENIGNLNIFSDSVKPGYDHLVVFDIRNKEGRVSVLDSRYQR